ncbi:endolytic transglycosylase MltG [Nocardia cyriacigeorgica]|uniref:endolytic transglycosylase MltG n=1 Tax=Nocardia cyriacigeorgica TaxID=135487 RepID=UPI0018958772|nr:endolytic transglycosylase MltG [Nocardia cyriacigeorgica]MBF6416737.1 endolytic transglycosylase MltG [Nocardia cyriacigeorgica]
MTDRWARAEERFRQREADRRYRRDDQAWGRDTRAEADVAGSAEDEWNYLDDDDTTVIPRYTDDDDLIEPEPEPEPEPVRRTATRTKTAARSRPRTEAAEGRRGARQRPGARSKKKSRVASRKAAERKRRRRTMLVVAAVFAVLFVGAAGFAGMKLMDGYTPAEDFAGPAGPPVVVRVHPGETATEIADTMAAKGVVASSAAFYEAAVRNSNMNSVQPGYYAIPSRSPAADAVAALVKPDSRVGNLVISEGRQLHDQHDVNTGARKEGIYTKIAAASCIGTDCVTYQELEAAGAGMDLAALGVPEWAMESVRQVPDRARQLEGLIAAGSWDFDPSGTPEQILKELVSASAALYESTGLLQSGGETGLTPYESLIAASLVEREALPQDMGKVARVIVNRLKVDQPLQFDSTVNYALDTTEVATTDADRARRTPWNTYAMAGLPATPIAAPSAAALRAVEQPEPGPWLYFVTIDKQGTTLFTQSYTEHLRNIDRAMESGILDSGR